MGTAVNETGTELVPTVRIKLFIPVVVEVPVAMAKNYAGVQEAGARSVQRLPWLHLPEYCANLIQRHREKGIIDEWCQEMIVEESIKDHQMYIQQPEDTSK